MSDEQKAAYEAKARFFRALGYRTLCYLYGDVPLQLEEVTAPKTDYTREARATVLAQAVQDLEFATANLPEINTVKDGEISKPVAYMLLAELYLATGANDKAVGAATAVIDNPNLKLMTERFGSQVKEDGDVFYDLFRPNNQNRASGNTESIWVIQFETNVDGGGNNTSHFFWNPGSFWGERFFAPQVDKFHIITPATIYLQPLCSDTFRSFPFTLSPLHLFTRSLFHENSSPNVVRRLILDPERTLIVGAGFHTDQVVGGELQDV